VIIPSPDLLLQGAKEFRTTKAIEMASIGTDLAEMIQIAFESNVFACEGTVMFVIQPIKKKETRQ
jgi:hypothetical protein